MGFMNLYTKSTANPKDIDFAKVGTTVKNKIPDAAIKAFLAKVPKPQAKPFEFKFEKDYDTGKLQITVKQVGFVFGWVDESFAANKLKMKAVEKEIDGWKARVELSMQSLGVHQAATKKLKGRVEDIEGVVISGQVDPGIMKGHEAAKKDFNALSDEANKERAGVVQFWNGGPKEGVLPLMKKHGLPVDQIGGEKKEADAEYAKVQGLVRKFQEEFTKLGEEVAALIKRLDEAGVKLFLRQNANRDRASELEDMQVAIQKDIGDFQGQKNADFAAVGAKGLLQEAKEFTGKSGTAWTKLSANSGEIDKTIARVEQVFQTMRIRAGGVEQQFQAWQKPTIPRGGNMPKYKEMLKMVYDEYMVDLNTLQDALKLYKAALLKQKPKAVEQEAKMKKAVVKAMAKAEAKSAKKGK